MIRSNSLTIYNWYEGIRLVLTVGWFFVAVLAVITSIIVLVRHFNATGMGNVAGKALTGQMAAVGSILLMLTVSNTTQLRVRVYHPKYSCVAYLRQIDGAKQQWALENKKRGEDVPATSDITPFLKNSTLSVCPIYGVYTLNAVSTDPTCSKSAFGHSLQRITTVMIPLDGHCGRRFAAEPAIDLPGIFAARLPERFFRTCSETVGQLFILPASLSVRARTPAGAVG